MKSIVNPVFAARPIPLGSPTIITDVWRYGRLVRSIYLDFDLTIALGTATGPIADGLERLIEDVQLKLPSGLHIQASGRDLNDISHIRHGVRPVVDAIVAASGVYRGRILIPLWNPLAFEDPDICSLDLTREASLQLTVSAGTFARLFTTVGTGSATLTLSASYEEVVNPGDYEPVTYPYIQGRAAQDPNVSLTLELERSPDAAISQIIVNTTDAQLSGQGAFDSNVLGTITLEDQTGDRIKSTPVVQIQRNNAVDYAIVSGVLAGRYVVADFTREGLFDGLEPISDDDGVVKSTFQLRYSTATPAGRFVHAILVGVRSKRPLQET